LRQDFQCDFQCGADPSEEAMLTNSCFRRHCLIRLAVN
jgi:hypothetical protein